jgi:hypothetical protein
MAWLAAGAIALAELALASLAGVAVLRCQF